jgi:hypothetical protein
MSEPSPAIDEFFRTYQIDHLKDPVQPVVMEQKPGIVPVPAQGTVAPRVVRTPEQALKVPVELAPIHLDKAGVPLPDWVQVGGMFHRPGKKVAIVGFADTRSEAPFTDPSWEIWGLNDLHAHIPRFDRWFDIHDRENIDLDVTTGRADPTKCGIGGLKTLNVPIYMQDRYEDIPNSIKFPLAELQAKFGNYFTNSISFMIALALFEGYEEIGIWGVDMAVGKEYIKERPSVEHMIGIAQGRGVKVFIPDGCDLLKSRFIYGFQSKEQSAFNLKIESMRKGMEERINTLRGQEQQTLNQLRQIQDALQQYNGAMGFMAEINKVWSNFDDMKMLGK